MVDKKKIAEIAVLVTLVLYTVAKTIAENMDSKEQVPKRIGYDGDCDYDYGYFRDTS